MDVKDNSLPPERFYKRLSSVTPRNKPIPTLPLPSEKPKPQKPVVKPAYVVEKKKAQDKKPAPNFNSLWLGIFGITILVLIFSVNYLAHLTITTTTSPTAQATSALAFPSGTLGVGSTIISNNDGMKLLYVPAGNFLMGSTDADPNAQPNEKPQHAVYLDAFWIDQTDVTNAMYSKCVNAGVCNQPTELNSSTYSNYYGNSEFDNYPVMNITWYMANTYCKWVGRQLPTEAQWEKVARGTDGRMYPWGSTAPDTTLLNYNPDGGDTTAVGSYPKGVSPYGALDMAGNVWQWVADWYSATYYQVFQR